METDFFVATRDLPRTKPVSGLDEHRAGTQVENRSVCELACVAEHVEMECGVGVLEIASGNSNGLAVLSLARVLTTQLCLNFVTSQLART